MTKQKTETELKTTTTKTTKKQTKPPTNKSLIFYILFQLGVCEWENTKLLIAALVVVWIITKPRLMVKYEITSAILVKIPLMLTFILQYSNAKQI